MEFSTKEVNDLLDYSKTMIDHINLCKQIPCFDELRKLQYLTFAGMYYFYGAKYLNEIIHAFLDTEIIYSTESVVDALKKYTNNTSDKIEMLAESNALGFFYYDFDSIGIMQRKIFFFEICVYSYGEILECIVHEINHVVNSMNEVRVDGDDYISIRTGLSNSIFHVDGTIVQEKKALEEVYNALQTCDIIDCIFSFAQYDIKDPNIRESIERLKSDHQYGYRCQGYSLLTPIFKPLYDCDRFNLVVRESRLEGTLDKIELAFDSEAGEGAYKLLGEYFDELNDGDLFKYFVTKPGTQLLIKQYTK